MGFKCVGVINSVLTSSVAMIVSSVCSSSVVVVCDVFEVSPVLAMCVVARTTYRITLVFLCAIICRNYDKYVERHIYVRICLFTTYLVSTSPSASLMSQRIQRCRSGAVDVNIM